MKYVIVGLFLFVLLAGCILMQEVSGNETTQLPNPAAVNCDEKGYEYEIRTDETGGQYGVCKYEGEECDAWALYRGECCLQDSDCTCDEGTPKCENQNCTCVTEQEEPEVGLPNPASVNCADKGYDIETRTNEAGEYGVCKYQGKECEEWALYRGECCLQDSDCTCEIGTPKCENQNCTCVTEETLPVHSSKTVEEFLDEALEKIRTDFFLTHDGNFTTRTVKWMITGEDSKPDQIPVGATGMEKTVEFNGDSTDKIRGFGFTLFNPAEGGLADTGGIVVLNARDTILDVYYENKQLDLDIIYSFGTKVYELYNCELTEKNQYLADDGSWITNYLFDCEYGEQV